MKRISYVTFGIVVLMALLSACSRQNSDVKVEDDTLRNDPSITPSQDEVPQASAMAMENKFVREAGVYSLDEEGSTLRITAQRSGNLSLQVTWQSGPTASTAAPDQALLADGWFVFVETPNRIWVFDGMEGGCVLQHSATSLSDSSFSREIMASCPQRVLDALPNEVRVKYQAINAGDLPNAGPETTAENKGGSGIEHQP